MVRSCNKIRFISRIWLRFDTVNKLMWLCKNRTCEFKAYKVQLSAQSEWRKLTLPGQSIYIQMKVWSVGPSDQSSNVVLSSEQPADVNFYCFLYWLTFFVELCFFFSCFFIFSLNGRSLEKQRIKIRPKSFEMWDKEVICTFKITWCVCQKKGNALIFLLGM